MKPITPLNRGSRPPWIALLALLAWSSPAWARPAPPTVLARVDSLGPGLFQTGDRVRVATIPSGDIRIGKIAWYSADTLALRDEHARIPTTSIRFLERSVNRHSKAGRGIGIGALVGGTVLGLTVGAVAATDDPEYAALTVPASVLGGALIGMTIGGIAGATIHSETWVPAAVQPQMAQPGDRVRLTGPLIPGKKVNGKLAERTTDTLYVEQDGERVGVPLMPPVFMEVSLGAAPPSSTSSKILAVLGLTAGAVAGGILLGHDTKGWSYTSGILTGATVGGTSGWLLGRTMSRAADRERWARVEAR